MKVLGLSRNYTDEQAAELRKAGVNVLTQGADGSIRIGPGGGITLNRRSASVTRDLIDLTQHVKGLQEDVIDQMTQNGLSPATEVRLQWHGDALFAVTSPPTGAIDLSGLLRIPPL